MLEVLLSSNVKIVTTPFCNDLQRLEITPCADQAANYAASQALHRIAEGLAPDGTGTSV